MSDPIYKLLCGDLQVASEKNDKWAFVYLCDANDHEKFMLIDDEIVALRDYLNKVIVDYRIGGSPAAEKNKETQQP